MIVTILGAATGMIVLGITALKPKLFWTMLILVAIIAPGVFWLQYPLLDEYLLSGVLLGGLRAAWVRAVPYQEKRCHNGLHKDIFLLMVIYMIVQSLRGLLLWEDWLRAGRWIFYFGILGLASLIATKRDFPVPSARETSLIVAGGSVVYLSLYLAHGLFAEHIRGISRWDVQGVEWAGSAYALFPLVIALPAALFCLKDHIRTRRWLGLVVFSLALTAAHYYESRVSWLTIVTFSVLFPLVLRPKSVAQLWLSLILTYSLITWTTGGPKISEHIEMLMESGRALYAPRESDMDRNLHLQASFLTVSKDWTTLLFGYGIPSHHLVMRSELQALYNQHLPGVMVRDFVRTTGFPALLVDTGLLGVLLLGINFLLSVRGVLNRTGWNLKGEQVILLVAILFTFLWLLVSNIRDIVLFYLAIMPSGLFAQLGRYRDAQQILDTSVKSGRSDGFPK